MNVQQNMQQKVLKTEILAPPANLPQNPRELKWNQNTSDQQKIIIDLGNVHHSDIDKDDDVNILKDKKVNSIQRKKTTKAFNLSEGQQFIQIIVKNAANNDQEIG